MSDSSCATTWRSDSPEVYQQLLRSMIAADEPCQSPSCGVTMLGHLLAGLPPRLVDLVRAEDPGQAPRE